jgi:polyhydroxyalkanoate synthase
MLSTHEDHIAPWKSTYKATQLFSGPMKFVLSDSGHVAGVINPPVKHKYCFWTAGNDHPTSADDWFKQATKTGGSWWSDWAEWSAAFSGTKIPATPIVKNALADAPGTYVRSQQ